MAHYASKEKCSLLDFLPTKRLSAQKYSMFGCQVQFRHMVLLQGFSNCNAAWSWIPFHFYLTILSRGYTVSCSACLRNQFYLVVSSKNQKTSMFSCYPKKFSPIKPEKWYSPGCCKTKTPRTRYAEDIDKQFLALSRRGRFPQRAIQKRLAFYSVIQATVVQPSRFCRQVLKVRQSGNIFLIGN